MYPVIPVDESILARVTEADVQSWMVARLNQIRSNGLPVRSIELDALFVANEFHIGWTGHCSDECCISCDDSAEVERKLREACIGAPERKASEKRAEAKRLLEQAEELEKLASVR